MATRTVMTLWKMIWITSDLSSTTCDAGTSTMCYVVRCCTDSTMLHDLFHGAWLHVFEDSSHDLRQEDGLRNLHEVCQDLRYRAIDGDMPWSIDDLLVDLLVATSTTFFCRADKDTVWCKASWRRSTASGEATDGAIALVAALRHRRVRQSPGPPSQPRTGAKTKKQHWMNMAWTPQIQQHHLLISNSLLDLLFSHLL